MTPFKVTFRFQSPVVVESEYPIHLDALIAWAVVKEAEGADLPSPWQAADDLSFCLDSVENEYGKVWKASRLVFTPSRERVMLNMIRRADAEIFLRDHLAGYFTHGYKISGVDTSSGQYRAYQMLVPYQWMEKAEAWGVGDPEEVRSYLSQLVNIGKMGRNGFGLIKNMEVDIAPEAQEKWRLRVLPQGVEGVAGQAYFPAFHCLRPPYWLKTNRVMAMEPMG